MGRGQLVARSRELKAGGFATAPARFSKNQVRGEAAPKPCTFHLSGDHHKADISRRIRICPGRWGFRVAFRGGLDYLKVNEVLRFQASNHDYRNISVV